MRWRGSIWVLLCGIPACQSAPYVPAPVGHPRPLPAAAFDVVLDIMRDRYRRLAVADRAAFRLQSAWLPFQHGDIPGHRRVTVYRDDAGQLQVLVEVRFIGLGSGGLPETSPTRGDRRAEEELAGVLERALGG